MKRNLSHSAANASTKRRSTPLKLEQLEARLLMAFDVLESQLGSLSASDQIVSTPVVEPSVANTNQSLANFAVILANGQTILPNSRVDQTTRSIVLRPVGLNSDGQELDAAPRVSWIVSSTTRSARATLRTSAGVTTISFSHFADYNITMRSGNISTRFSVRAVAPATSLSIFNNNNSRLANNALVTISGASQVFTVVGFSSATQTTTLLQSSEWSVLHSPEGSSPRFQSQGNRTTVQFDRAGLYTLQVTNGSLTRSVRVQVNARLSSLSIDPSSNSLTTGGSLQLNAVGLDQFQQPVANQPAITWTATGGTISSTGLYQAGATAGDFRVTARSGSLSASVAIAVAAPDSNDGQDNNETTIVGINDSGLRELMQTYYADGSISRIEMIALLRSTANDNIVSATELADLRYIVSNNSPYNLPAHVRGLTRNLVHDNPANLRFRNQNAGNLVAGSSGSLLNQLVDKWFLGADLPTLTSSSISYRTAVGNLFNGAPGLSDAQQGMLGDCYFLASLVSIGRLNPTAIENMFTDNGDGTFTVRFYAGSLGLFWQGSLISAGFISGSGVADYVTVDRNLPTLSNGTLAYSGLGRSVLSASTPLWLALAEKAYAQWNETGRSGRNGTNTYTGIEGGWMSNVNAQVLGINSTYYTVNSGSKQAMINALSASRAVTIGTNPNASTGGLVGSHAYVVTGYNPSNDTFTLYNPWGTQHPTPLTWGQLQNQTSAFVVTDPSGSLNGGGSNVQSTSLALSVPPVEKPGNNDTRVSIESIDRLLADFAAEDNMHSSLADLAYDVPDVRDDHTQIIAFTDGGLNQHSPIESSLEESTARLEQILDSLVEVS